MRKREMLDNGVSPRCARSWSRYDIWDPVLVAKYQFDGWAIVEKGTIKIVKRFVQKRDAEKFMQMNKRKPYQIVRHVVE